jgi:hypothetical protein
MIDHLGFAVANVECSKAFYVNALKPLGISVIMEVSAEDTGGDAHAGSARTTRRSSGSAEAQSPRVGRMSRLQRPHAPMSMLSTARPWPPADGTMGRRG